jgi:hypothetical protein
MWLGSFHMVMGMVRDLLWVLFEMMLLRLELEAG